MNYSKLIELLPHKIAYAHCDIPCGIYDPNNLQMAAHTVLRMTQLLAEEKEMHQVSRLTAVKEKHGQLVEEEMVTLGEDYFKNEHYEKYKELEDLYDEVIMLSSKTRQKIDMESAKNLLEKTLRVAEIFYDSKGLKYKRVKSVYPTKLEVVVQD